MCEHDPSSCGGKCDQAGNRVVVTPSRTAVPAQTGRRIPQFLTTTCAKSSKYKIQHKKKIKRRSKEKRSGSSVMLLPLMLLLLLLLVIILLLLSIFTVAVASCVSRTSWASINRKGFTRFLLLLSRLIIQYEF